MTDLERQLSALEVEWPPTPDLAALVTPRLTGLAPAARRRRRTWLKRAAAALVVLVGGGLAVSPAARSALGDLLGLHGAAVRRVPPGPQPTPHPGRLGSGLHLGRAVTLGQAQRRLRFRLTLPPLAGRPDAVWLAESPGLPSRVSLIYGRRPDIGVSPHTNVALLVTEFRASVTEPLLQKALGEGAKLTRIAVPGGRAYAITGKPHGFAWIGAGGVVRFENRRLAGTTLLVSRGDGVLLRAEGRLSAAQLRRLARQLAAR